MQREKEFIPTLQRTGKKFNLKIELMANKKSEKKGGATPLRRLMETI